MAKGKYRFNPETLSYDKIQKSLKTYLIAMIPSAISVLFTSLFLYFVVFDYLLESPSQRQLRKQNEQITAAYNEMKKELDRMDKVLDDFAKRDDNLYRLTFNEEPIPARLRNQGVGGSKDYTEYEKYENSDLIIDVARKIDILERKIVVQSKSFDRLVSLAKTRQKMLRSIPAIQPVRKKDLNHIASFFGMRKHPILGYVRMHSGIDFSAQRGKPVFVTGDGRVTEAGWSKGGYGRVVVVDHGFGYTTVYAHLNRINVREGQKVKRGEKVGTVGSTGLSVSPHLHYEVRMNDVPIDPINFFYSDLSPEEYDKILEQSEKTN
ncbi:MAG: hypothetical protein A2W91_18170 [Bacteroidetes bacterium GWF2_38_335]|nr:MAG: hypothetical protein A2W91_18170 [Bacteroidetes bacterium GWF2_38_335]OFY80107.1 MAG: hypothetical protein A2281_12470 [Bacteroidetes bacterium RIFOXYA12_FULL_38_20]HBS88566.1 peptidase M23 [Bacteroidales bacterium]